MMSMMRDAAGKEVSKWDVLSDVHGNRYWLVGSDGEGGSEVALVLPCRLCSAPVSGGAIVGLKCDQIAKRSDRTATTRVAMPTASDFRDLLSEAEAIIADSRCDSSNAMNAGSSSKVRGSKSLRSRASAPMTLDSAESRSHLSRKSDSKSASHSSMYLFIRLLMSLSAIIASFALGYAMG